MQCNKPLIRANLILSDPEEEGETFFQVRVWERESVSLLSVLSKRRQFYYIVGNCWLYPNTLAKVQLILRCNGNSGIWCFANGIHHTSNPT